MQRFGGKFINGFQNLQFLHGFSRLLRHYSSKSTSISTISFETCLVSSLGFSHKQALSISSKLSEKNRKLNDRKISSNSTDSMVCFLKDYGFDETLIRKIVSSNPTLLCSKVDKTLKPKFDFFKDEGFSKDDIIRFISANSNILTMGLDSAIAPAIRILREVLICDSHVISVLMKLKIRGFGSVVQHLLPNVDLLTSYGISIEVIRKHLLRQPLTFCRKHETFRAIVAKVDKRLGLSCDSTAFIYGIHLACSFSEENIESKIQTFKSFGWTQSDVEMLMMKHACCFTSSKENITKKLSFLMNELKLEPAYLIAHCCILSLSLEKRMVPRHEVLQILKAKELLKKIPSFDNVVRMVESRFATVYVLPFKEVHQVYASHIGVIVTQERADDLHLQ